MNRLPRTRSQPTTQVAQNLPYAQAQPLAQPEALEQVTAQFAPISLREMDDVALLNRIDTKFVLSSSQLFQALQRIRNDYRILAIGGQRIHHYRTLYFDTPAFDFYHDQVTGRGDVFKVRSRDYLDTQLSFLEVKHKNPKKRTEKSRLSIAYNVPGLDEEMAAYLGALIPVAPNALEPKLYNIFNRLTLVNKAGAERLTIDVDLSFANEMGSLSLSNIAIAEVKQDQFCPGSPFLAEMRLQGVRRTGFSKYCYGVAQLVPGVKKNAQKERILMVEKIRNGGNYVSYA